MSIMHRVATALFLCTAILSFATPTRADEELRVCQCSDLPKLTKALRFAIRMRDEHSVMARTLTDDATTAQDEHKRYHKWKTVDLPAKLEKEAAAAAAANGSPAPKQSSTAYEFESAGRAAWIHGDFDGTSSLRDSADGGTTTDYNAAELAKKVAQWRKRTGQKNALCDHADLHSLQAFARSNSACKAIEEAVILHEDTHVKQCKAGGSMALFQKQIAAVKSPHRAALGAGAQKDPNVAFMEYQLRSAKDRALGEVAAHAEEAERLAKDIRALLKGKGVKVMEGNKDGPLEDLALLKVECNAKLGLGVTGLKFKCMNQNGSAGQHMFVDMEGATCSADGRGLWEFRFVVTLTGPGGRVLPAQTHPAPCVSRGVRVPDTHDTGMQCFIGGPEQAPQLTVKALGDEYKCSQAVRTVTAPIIQLETCEQPSAQGYRPPTASGGKRPNS